MQTHEWEALLDGTTPGPWAGIADENTTCITTPDGVLIDVDEHWSSCSEADARLAAHAPAAVAEVVRLRREIEAVRDDYQRSADVDRLLSQFSIAPMEPVFDDLVDALTRILEGNTDE